MDLMLDILSYPQAYAELDEVERFKICNGCGSAKAKFDFVPDTIWGLNITPVCFIHDFRYWIGKTLADKDHADLEFLENLMSVIEHRSIGILKPFRRRRALKYYEMVVWQGEDAFWQGKAPDASQSLETIFDGVMQ